MTYTPSPVIPVNRRPVLDTGAGIHSSGERSFAQWIPAFAGMTIWREGLT